MEDKLAIQEQIKIELSNIKELRTAAASLGIGAINPPILEKELIEAANLELTLQLVSADISTQKVLQAEYRLSKRIEAYSAVDGMLLEAIAESYDGRPEKMEEYLALRASIKTDNPL